MRLVVGSSPPPPARAPPTSPEMNGNYANGSTTPLVLDKESKLANIVRRKLTGYVGFANLPNQWHRKSVRKGFNFNVMVVGNIPVGVGVDVLSVSRPCPLCVLSLSLSLPLSLVLSFLSFLSSLAYLDRCGC